MARRFETIYKALNGMWTEVSIHRAIEYLYALHNRRILTEEVEMLLMTTHQRLDRPQKPSPTPLEALEDRERLEAEKLRLRVERIVAEKIANEAIWRKTHAAKIARAKAWQKRIERSVANGTILFY